jgi:hypothetical protein
MGRGAYTYFLNDDSNHGNTLNWCLGFSWLGKTKNAVCYAGLYVDRWLPTSCKGSRVSRVNNLLNMT